MTMETQPKEEAPALYAIVELFGHAKIAGRITEQTCGGQSFARVDVPEVTYEAYDYSEAERRTVQKTIQPHTRSFGPGAIYSINWCDQTAAVLAAKEIQHKPVVPYSAAEVLRNMPPDQIARLLKNDKHTCDFIEVTQHF
jgi:hypothetical protein